MGRGLSVRCVRVITLTVALLTMVVPVHAQPTPTNPPTTQTKTHPRTWLWVAGGAFFALGYGLALGTALSGGDDIGPDGKWTLGNEKLLYIPFAGPFMYDSSRCNDGDERFSSHAVEGAPDHADYCGSFYGNVAGVPQILGGLMIALSFATPQRSAATSRAATPQRSAATSRAAAPQLGFRVRPGGAVLGLNGSF